MNVFEAVKQSVTTRQAAEHYGIWVGRNGMAVCPFHSDKTPSLKVDRRFHCFGCQADGDWNPLFVEALQKESHVEYLLDTLLFGTLHERASLITEYGKEVRNLERRMAELAAPHTAGREGNGRHGRAAPAQSRERHD